MADATTRHPVSRTVPKGVMHVPVTPFRDDAAVDYGTFEKLVDWHVRQKGKLRPELEALGIFDGSEPFGW